MNFIDYIEELSKKHVDIRHDPVNAIHFLGSGINKHTSIDSVLSYPAVIIDRGYGYSFSGSPIAYFTDHIYQLFILMHISDTSDYNEIEQTFYKCESILFDFLNKIMEDKKNKKYRFLSTFKLEDVECEFVVNADNSQYGVLALISLPEPYKPLLCFNKFL